MLNKTMRSILLGGLAAGVSVLATSANAQTSLYTSRTAFNIALGTTVSNDLNSLVNGAAELSFGIRGIAMLSGATVTGGQINNPNNGIPFSFTIIFSQPLNGFGADFTSPGTLTSARAFIQAFNGSSFLGGIGFAGLASSNPSFLGIITVGSFDRIVISENFGTSPLNLFQSVDNPTVGAAIASIPEPAALVLFITGLAIICGVPVHRSRQQRWPRKSGQCDKWTLCNDEQGLQPEKAGRP